MESGFLLYFPRNKIIKKGGEIYSRPPFLLVFEKLYILSLIALINCHESSTSLAFGSAMRAISPVM